MKHPMFYVFLLLAPMLTLAQDNQNFIMLGKAKSDGKIVKAKGLFKSLMIGHEQAIILNREESFITHITEKVHDKIILDVSTSPSLARRPKINYKFKDIGYPKSIQYIITDNRNNTKELSFDIKRKSSLHNVQEKVEYLNNYQIIDFRKLIQRLGKLQLIKKQCKDFMV